MKISIIQIHDLQGRIDQIKWPNATNTIDLSLYENEVIIIYLIFEDNSSEYFKVQVN